MTEELLRKSLSRCPLFGGLSRETLDSLTGDDRAVRTYTDGEIIGSTDESGLPLLIVLAEGKATVTTPNAGRNVLLRFLGAGDLFGIANLFSDAPSVSTVRASGGCTCLLIPEDTVRALLDRDRGFRQNYIGYLSGRVRFLNRKIGYLTAGSASGGSRSTLRDSGRARLRSPNPSPLSPNCSTLAEPRFTAPLTA